MDSSAKTVIIVQARMTSTRLPGKILKEVLGRSLLEFEIERLKQIPSRPEIWIATTTNATDDLTVGLAKKLNVPFYRGSEDDVLGRYYHCANTARADVIVRITADCPLIDPDIVETVIREYSKSGVDYVSNTLTRTYPRGLDVEVFSFKSLEEAFHKAKEPAEREHVTRYIYKYGRTKNISSASGDFSQHRWTVDTPEDFELIKRLLEALYPTNSHFRVKDALQVLKAHTDWSEINAAIEQKKE